MSAAATAQSEPSPLPEAEPDVETLQDILYDRLAMGIDEEASSTQVAIEGFLHEHAREPKSASEFRAFFERFGLPTALGKVGSDVRELPPITSVRELPAVVEDAPVEVEVTHTDVEADWPSKVAEPARLMRFGWTWVRPGPVAIALLSVALLVVAWRGYAMIQQLRGELSTAAERHERDHDALKRLSDQAANLESSVAATGELMQRVDQKSDLLLDSLAPAKQQPRPQVQRGN